MKSDWTRVSRKAPCPICKKPSWCGVSSDGAIVHCQRVESDKPARGDMGGWIHRLTDKIDRPQYVPPPKPHKPSTFDATNAMKIIRDATSAQDFIDLGAELGVDPSAIDGLGAGKSSVHRAWAFPMRDPLGNIIGVRLRNSAGEKWAITGSRQGLFFETLLAPDADRVLYVCEGPTDTAAAMSIGLPTCGRAACLGQVEAIRNLCRARGFARVVIIADNDEAKAKPDGTLWYPGQDGARKLAAEIKMWVKLVIPPAKDLRQWLRSGATRAAIDCIVHQQIWRAA